MTAIEHVMDTATVRIGRDVVGYKAREQGRRLKHAQSMKIQKEKNEPIEVYSGSTYVAEMPLCLLTRFSKLAAGALPRSKNGSNISATATVDKDTETSGKRKLILHHWSGVEPPTDASVLICLDYMRDNKSPTAEVLEYFYQRLPEGKLLTATLASIVEKQINEQYSVAEDTALTDVIDSHVFLTRHMNGIRSSRIRKRCNADYAAKMKMGWDKVEAEATCQGASLAHISNARIDTAVHSKIEGHGRQKAKAGRRGSKTKSKKSKLKETSITPQPKKDHFEEAEHRAEEANRTGNGKGVNGKHVPGA